MPPSRSARSVVKEVPCPNLLARYGKKLPRFANAPETWSTRMHIPGNEARALLSVSASSLLLARATCWSSGESCDGRVIDCQRGSTRPP